MSGRAFLTPTSNAAVDPVRSTVMPSSTMGMIFGRAAGRTVNVGTAST